MCKLTAMNLKKKSTETRMQVFPLKWPDKVQQFKLGKSNS